MSANTTDGSDDKDDGLDEGQGKVKVDPPTTEPVLTPLRQVFSLWYMAVIFLTPVLLLPLPLVINTQASASLLKHLSLFTSSSKTYR